MKLVIVESPGKIKTISKYLGNQYTVTASLGHIRDLPSHKDELPEKLRSEPWAHLGIDVTQQFKPYYVNNPQKRQQIEKIKELSKKASEIILATDGDREGESIAWHLLQVIKPQVPVSRMEFFEITQSAIQQALQNKRQLNMPLVGAQESRRCVDRLYGFEISPLLWKLGPKLSAGRVQSVALRMVVEREWERMHFIPANFITLEALTDAGFTAKLTHFRNQKIATGKDFDARGTLKTPVHALTEKEALFISSQIKRDGITLTADEEKPFREKPPAPFITSTLQQEASRKLGFTVKKTMDVAQKLYEQGFITYMRTDSPALSDEATKGARTAVAALMGTALLPANPRVYVSKNKSAQEAHEAIRPAGATFKDLTQAEVELSKDEFGLYALIYKRTLASQMIDAQGRTRTLTLTSDDATFSASGKTYDELGFRTLYHESKDDETEENHTIPPLEVGDLLDVEKTSIKHNQTEAPARYSEPRLVQTLERAGIGRPSTYAAILTNIEKRGYIERTKNTLHATWLGILITRFLLDELPSFLDYQFTAQMEQQLDDIAAGKGTRLDYLNHFYYGKNGLRTHLDHLLKRSIHPPDVTPLHLKASNITVQVGKEVTLTANGKTVVVPTQLKPDELTLKKASELLEKQPGASTKPTHAGPKIPPRNLGMHDHEEVWAGISEYGPYIRIGKAFHSISLHPDRVLQLTLPDALKLVSEKTKEKKTSLLRELKKGKGHIRILDGKYGIYLTNGQKNAPLPNDKTVESLTYQEALDIIKSHTPKTRTA